MSSEKFLSSSPTSVALTPLPASPPPLPEMKSGGETLTLVDRIANDEKARLTLAEFAEALPRTILRARGTDGKRLEREGGKEQVAEDDPISNLLRRLVLNEEEWYRFALFDASKNYTRNLIATDGQTFTLMLLCWNPDRESPIHDHPCDGCWMRVCQGKVRERRYVADEELDRLRCTTDNVYQEGQLAYIADSMGYHKVGNPSDVAPAVTMHLYSPPFERCKIWLDPSRASSPSMTSVRYHSEYGTRL